MSYLVIAYPHITEQAFLHIQAHRKIHDVATFAVVKPHFTLVFPVTDISEQYFCKEISALTNGTRPFGFSVCNAIVHSDPLSRQYFSFLVPYEGNSELVALHDRLYSGMLSKELRKDLPYSPHITIGSSADSAVCKQMTTDWNTTATAISGTINQLTIVRLHAGIVNSLQVIPLQ